MNWIDLLKADDGSSAFEVLPHPTDRIVVRRGYEPMAGALGFGSDEVRPVLHAIGGREAHPVVETAGGERILIRRYRRGGLLRRLNRERYFVGHRAMEEVRATERAVRNGVRVPVVIGARERPGAAGYTAMLATRWIEGARGLDAWLRVDSPGPRSMTLHAAGSEIRKMHTAGIGHPDLNLRNILVAPTGNGSETDVYLIDFDRARIYPGAVPERRRARDLRRLRRSADKLGAAITHDDWRTFRDGYGVGWPLGDDLFG